MSFRIFCVLIHLLEQDFLVSLFGESTILLFFYFI